MILILFPIMDIIPAYSDNALPDYQNRIAAHPPLYLGDIMHVEVDVPPLYLGDTMHVEVDVYN